MGQFDQSDDEVIGHSSVSGCVSPKVDPVKLFAAPQQFFSQHALRSPSLQPKRTIPVQIHGRTGVFTSVPDLVCKSGTAASSIYCSVASFLDCRVRSISRELKEIQKFIH